MRSKYRIVWMILVAVMAVAIFAVVIHAVANPFSVTSGKQITKMAQYLNDKYGFSLTKEDCTYFREEDYTYHDAFLYGTTYDVPNIAIFRYEDKYITVTDRNGFISDDAQLGELNELLCGYFEERTGLDIAFVEVRNETNGNTKDETLNAYLHHSFNHKLTSENIGEFADGLLNGDFQSMELLFYFTAQPDALQQLNQITMKLGQLKGIRNGKSIRFYITDMQQLNVHYFEPKVLRQTGNENSREADEGYIWGHYHVVNSVEHHYPVSESSYYQDVQYNTFLYGGAYQSGGSAGFGNREIKMMNGFAVVDLSQNKLQEYMNYMHSYGDYRDMTILMEVGDGDSTSEVIIGRERYQWNFQWNCGSIRLYAFKLGSLIDLQTAWDCGYLSPDDMDQILKDHVAYLAQQYE